VRVEGSGVRVQGSGVRVQGSGCTFSRSAVRSGLWPRVYLSRALVFKAHRLCVYEPFKAHRLCVYEPLTSRLESYQEEERSTAPGTWRGRWRGIARPPASTLIHTPRGRQHHHQHLVRLTASTLIRTPAPGHTRFAPVTWIRESIKSVSCAALQHEGDSKTTSVHTQAPDHARRRFAPATCIRASIK